MTRPVCFVTGTTHGIGTVTVRHLAERGYTVIMACRDLDRGRSLRDQLRRSTNNKEIHVIHCDLASLASVRNCAATFSNEQSQLHLLINNAGMMTTRHRLSEDGVELTFATNYLGPWLLTLLLLDALQSPAQARIVNVASKVHFSGSLSESELGDLTVGATGGQRFSGMSAYARSKLANVMFTLSLAERLQSSHAEGMTVNCLHPGVIATNITAQTNAFLRIGMKLAAPFMFDPERGAKTTLHLALDPALASTSGCYFDEQQRQVAPSAAASNRSARQALWRWSEAITGLDASSSSRRSVGP